MSAGSYVFSRLKPFLKAFLWVVFVYFFGLLHLLLLIVASSIVSTINFSLEKVLLDGSVLFFATALISTLAIDYYFSENRELPKWFSGLFYALLPLLLIIIIVFLFAIFLAHTHSNIYMSKVKYWEYAILSSTTIYAFIDRSILFEMIRIKNALARKRKP